MEQEAQQDNTKWLITLYHKKHWDGMTLKRLRIGWHRGLFFEWENGGSVMRRPIIG